MVEDRSWDETPACEVRIYRDGTLLTTELCRTDDEAAEIAARWSEDAAVSVEVDDLTIRHRPGDVLEPEPAVTDDADYPDVR